MLGLFVHRRGGFLFPYSVHTSGRAPGAQQGIPYRLAHRLAWEAFTE